MKLRKVNEIKLERIEVLCEVHSSSWSYGDQLLPIGKYKLFYSDGEAYIQNYILIKDKKQVGSLKRVTKFSDSAKEKLTKSQPKNNETRN